MGNRNAYKHGFYAQALTNAEQAELQGASVVNGVDEELALLRWRLSKLVQNDPDNLDLIVTATREIARLVKVKYQLSADQADNLADALTSVLSQIGSAAGLSND